MNGFGYQGPQPGDLWTRNNNSTVSKMEHTFWVTKQSISRKFGKKEDECVVASDAELDAKLELFRSVQDTCLELQRILDKYQERLCNLAQEESAMGRFLKESSKRDKTNAGKAMTSVGNALAYSGQQRLCLRVPLQRLYHEVETFRQRAIEDTLLNVTAMERQRTEYRAALNWMKNISQELDPDTYKQLEKFRRVQAQVRESKTRFDKQKLDCLQKVDLLAAARCNMFSHALTLYQTALLQHARRAHRAHSTVAKQIKGYQHYEFSVMPELTEESSRLAKQTSEAVQGDEDRGKDELLFFDAEYHDKDEPTEPTTSGIEACKSDSLQNLLSSGTDQNLPSLIPFEADSCRDPAEPKGMTDIDLLASDCLNQLDDLLSKSSNEISSPHEDWASLFGSGLLENGKKAERQSPGQSVGGTTSGSGLGNDPSVGDASDRNGAFLPSQLLDHFASTLQLNTPLQPEMIGQFPTDENGKQKTSVLSASGAEVTQPAGSSTSSSNFVFSLVSNMRNSSVPQSGPPPPLTMRGRSVPMPGPGHSGLTSASSTAPPPSASAQDQDKGTWKKDMSAWFDLFADLDPLANPDALGAINPEEERNC